MSLNFWIRLQCYNLLLVRLVIVFIVEIGDHDAMQGASKADAMTSMPSLILRRKLNESYRFKSSKGLANLPSNQHFNMISCLNTIQISSKI